MKKNILESEIKVVNIGLERFYKDLKDQKVPVVNLDWKPPAAGNKKMLDLLMRMKKKN